MLVKLVRYTPLREDVKVATTYKILHDELWAGRFGKKAKMAVATLLRGQLNVSQLADFLLRHSLEILDGTLRAGKVVLKTVVDDVGKLELKMDGALRAGKVVLKTVVDDVGKLGLERLGACQTMLVWASDALDAAGTAPGFLIHASGRLVHGLILKVADIAPLHLAGVIFGADDIIEWFDGFMMEFAAANWGLRQAINHSKGLCVGT